MPQALTTDLLTLRKGRPDARCIAGEQALGVRRRTDGQRCPIHTQRPDRELSTTMSSSMMLAPRLSLHADPVAGHSVQMTLFQRARWNLGVLAEMAKPGHMGLAPIFDDDGQVIDFTWREASPTSTLAFGCAGEYLVGRRLKQVLVECAKDASVFASYRTVFLQQRAQVLRVDGQDGVAVHRISPLPCGLTVRVTSVGAMDRVLAARRAVRRVESLRQHRLLDQMPGRPGTT